MASSNLAWFGIIVWGIVVTAFGLGMAGPTYAEGGGMQPQDVLFLVAGGLLSCLIGMTGLAGMMGWIPGLRSEPDSRGLRTEQKSVF
ncbi:hypothetical protein [Massilia cavernae]|uniref:Uncharacterized protein n=1 Tax=Massilia cavernae TaxID=2320864 RepID=A0A418Y733_9BURK|nr:hypothetical protein [Massilia cavernae]RJG24745.1 hypothetical protein D3872_03290 [Massilia cavernae]